MEKIKEYSCADVGALRFESHSVTEKNLEALNRRIKRFDLQVGDIVQHSRILIQQSEFNQGRMPSRRLRDRYRVVGIYPNVFHCEILGHNATWCESFQRKDYQLGEVVRINDRRTETE